MARTLVAVINDDLTGEVIEEGEAVTIEFAVNSKAYSIDLGRKNAADFHKALEKYIAAATRVGASTRGRKPAARGKTDLAAIRGWASDNGYAVAARGRISAEIKEAYERAH
jgi:hypothetical protein